jgi:hypothetical protein
MKNKIKYFLVALVLLSTLNLLPSTARAQGTAFNYQGQLNSGGSPANGFYDFQFSLSNAPSGGSQVGGTVTSLAVGVTNGLFATTLDFGSVFTGDPTWLAISVRSNGTGSYVWLSPLQPVTPAPYSVFANTASNLSGSLPTAQLSGEIPATQLSGPVSNTQLANSAVTVNAGAGLSGGGAVSLGNSTTLYNAGVISVTGNGDITANNVSGAVALGSTATDANTFSAIVKRDGSGNFSAGTITLNGNLYLPSTTGIGGIIYSGGNWFVHASGSQNFFAGWGGGNLTMSGIANTGIGRQALTDNTSGSYNEAAGSYALFDNTMGSDNTANGYEALTYNTSGHDNTANGYDALYNNTNGSYNIALGSLAGVNLTTGSFNIDIGNNAIAGESYTIRIGSANQNKTFIAGISGVTVASGVAVVVNSSGQLGITSSSARFKQDIHGMDDASDVLLSLRPVTFHYKPGIDPQGIPQFGLVAEEVDKVAPELVARDDKNQIYTVRYEAINAMLLNEFLKQHSKVEEQNTEIERLKQKADKVDSLEKRLDELGAMLKSLSEGK